MRCSECGRQHKTAQLEAWYAGPEQRRVEQVIWLIAAGLFLRLWAIPSMLGVWLPVLLLAPLVGAILTGWACGVAGWRRFESDAGRYAIVGLIAAGLQVLWSMREIWRETFLGGPAYTMTFITLDLMVAWLLFAAMARPLDALDIWGAVRARRIAMFGLLLTPFIAVTYSVLNEATYRAGQLLIGSAANQLLGILWSNLLGHILPYAVLLAVWLFQWRWFAAYRRALFAPRDR